MSPLTLVFCGDTILCPEKDCSPLFESVSPLIASADIAFCNLETCLSDIGEQVLKCHVIRSEPGKVTYLRSCGFHVINVANNHIIDFGYKGCLRTIEVLQQNNFHVVGMRNGNKCIPVILEKKNVKIGFLGYANYGFKDVLMPLREKNVIEDIGCLKERVDIVVVSLHWGYEYVDYPSPEQQAFAREAIDAGARLIIGHHPHVIQGIERYADGLIAYSIGNFQFQINQEEELRDANSGFVFQVYLPKEGPLSYNCIPVFTDSNYRVNLADQKSSALQISKLEALSRNLAGKRIRRLFWLKEACRFYFPMQLHAWRYRIQRGGFKEFLQMIKWLSEPLNLLMLFVYLLICAGFLRLEHAGKD